MNPKIHQLILLLVFLAVCSGSVPQSEDKNLQDLQGLSQNPITDFRSVLEQYRVKISQYPKFNEISQSLNQIGTIWQECLTKLLEIKKANQILQMTLNSALNDSLHVNPINHEKTIKQKVDERGKVLSEMRISFEKLKQAIHEIPSNQLTDGSGKKHEELTHKLSRLRSDLEICSDEHIKLLDTFERIDQQNNAALREIQEFEKSILIQINILKKNNDLLNDLERQTREKVEQLLANLKENQGNYITELTNQRKTALASSEEKIKQMDEKLVELQTKLAELQAAENQDPNVLQGIEEEIQRTTDEKKSEMQERMDIIKSIDELSAESAPSSQDESMINQKRLSLLQVFEGEKIKLLQENEKAQSKIKDLRSKIDKIRTFTATLEDLRQTKASKKQECNKIQENIQEKEKEMDMLLDDENLEVGVLTQLDLIKGMGKVMASKQSLVDLMGPVLSKLEIDHYGLENFLQNFNFKSLQENIQENPDFYLAQVYNQDSCKEGVDCLQEILMHKIPETKFNTRTPLATHLSAIFTRINSVRFMLEDENNEFPKIIQHFMKIKLLAHKKSLWTLTSLAQSVVDHVFDSNPTLFIKIGEEELENEMIILEAIYSSVRNQVMKNYEKFVLNKWKDNLQEANRKFSSSNMLSELSIVPASEQKLLIS